MKNFLRHFVAEIRSVVRDRWLVLSVAALGPAALGWNYLARVRAWESGVIENSGSSGPGGFPAVLFPIFAVFAAYRIFADINAASSGSLWRTWPVPIRIWAGARASVAGVFLVLWPAFVVFATGLTTHAPNLGGQLFITFAVCWLATMFGVYRAVRSPAGKSVGIAGFFILGQVVLIVALAGAAWLTHKPWRLEDGSGFRIAGWFYALALPIAAWRVIRRPVARAITVPELTVILLTIPVAVFCPELRVEKTIPRKALPEVFCDHATGVLKAHWTHEQGDVEFRPVEITVPGWPALSAFSTETLSAEFRVLGAAGAGKWYPADGVVSGKSKGGFSIYGPPPAETALTVATGKRGEAAMNPEGGDASFLLLLPTEKAKGRDIPAWRDVAGRRVEIRATIVLTANRSSVALRTSAPGKYSLGDDSDWRASATIACQKRERNGRHMEDWSMTILSDRRPQWLPASRPVLLKSYAVFFTDRSGKHPEGERFNADSWQGMSDYSKQTFTGSTESGVPEGSREVVLVESRPGKSYVVPLHIVCDVRQPDTGDRN